MAVLQDDDVRFRRLSRRIGVFLLVAAAGVVGTLVFIGVQQELFTAKTRILFFTDSGRGIVQGMAVKLSGFNIGRVRRLSLTKEAKVKVMLEINTEYMKWVRQDSKARLLKEGLIGDSVIEISPGSEASPELTEDNKVIAFEREIGIGQLVDQIYADVQPLIHDLRSIARRADTLLAGLPQTQAQLDAALKSAQRNFENLERVTATELPAAVREGRAAVEKTKKVVDSVSRTWPISNNMEKPEADVLPLDSYANPRPVTPAQ
jgi:phospholipid/cholesterol/gamma-HCH transport system substrate-binding protein